MLSRALISLLILAAAFPALGEAITGRIVGITDGDTLTLLDTSNQQHKIRLAGIDSPEKGQDFGEKAKANLSALAFNKEASADCRKRDRNRRQICAVTVDGKDLGLEQVRAGMAWWYRQYVSEQTPQQRTEYEMAESEARARRLGLWSGKNPIPPWDWAHRKLEE